ncbi:sodium:solute symporter family protein [Paracoccus pantotrophus]|uniref:Sodium:solute symporter family protein n=1 Tax=Paracoccus pantotrophus TaxID=82367 RepID=A0A7H9BUW5_PARPN|nr:sodium:solute symporter family protein [Paracoccus pantotrophus]QLH14972.1 sodium:solute symporter family protein [Paracoccus pantotrophus]
MSISYLIVFGGYLAFLTWTCLKSMKEVESLSDFTTGGHRMGLLLGVGTSVATWVSVASVMGVPGQLYRTGVAAIIGWVAGWFLATAVMPILAYKVRRPELPARTFPEFIRMRFEPFERISGLQLIVAALMLVGYFVFCHLQVVGFGIVFNTITGIRYEYAIFAFLVLLALTSLGGFWSVAATDTLNAVLILVGLAFGTGAILYASGGLGPILDAVATTTAPTNVGGEPLEPGILLSPAGTFGWSVLMGIFMSNALGASVAPHWINRFMAPRNSKAAVLQMMWTVIALIPIFLCLIVIGLGAKALLPSLPADKTTDYIMPLIVQNYAPPFVGALTLIALLAAAVSTASSMLLNCGTSLYYDLYRSLYPDRRFDDDRATRHLRYSVLVLGLLSVISAIKPPVLLAMGFTYVYGAFGAAFMWPVWFGLFWKRMNRAGAYAGIIVGVAAFVAAKAMGADNPFVVGAGLSLLATLAGVFLSPAPPKEAYEAYFDADVSPSTRAVALRIRRESDHAHETQGAAPLAAEAKA